MVANKVPKLGSLVAGLKGPGQCLDFHWVRRVVEIDDIDVKDQHSRARDLVSWSQMGEWVSPESKKGCLRSPQRPLDLPHPEFQMRMGWDGMGCLCTQST